MFNNGIAQLPDNIYGYLPDILQSGCNLFDDKTERDIFLLSTLTVISGCLPNVYGKYDNRCVGTNIYLFIVASASSGKGVINWARYFGKAIHDNKRETSKIDRQTYEQTVKNAKTESSKANIEFVEEPKSKRLFIPANSSSAVFLKVLSDNDGKGILFETEADTLSQNLKQDWGNYDTIMRAAFHHEPVNQLRRNEDLEIENPCLSILLSGTPEQVRNFIPTPENGLFSRFCFYSFPLKLEWKNVFTHTEVDIEQTLRYISEKSFALYTNLEKNQGVYFDLSSKQKQTLNECFETWQKELFLLCGREIIPTIRRLGLITFRISMILTCARFEKELHHLEIIKCTNIDFEIAMSIIEVLIDHAVNIYSILPRQQILTGKKAELYRCLPTEFSWDVAIKQGQHIQMSEATINRFLRTHYFEKTDYGKYQKTK